MEIHLPSAALKPYVKYFLIVESESGSLNRILPDTAPVLSFRFKGRIHQHTADAKILLPAMAITGLKKAARLIRYDQSSAAVLVIFKTSGAAAFFEEPLYEWYDQSVALDALSGLPPLSRLEDQLSEAGHPAQGVAAIEQFLLSRLKHQKSDLLISAALQDIQGSAGNLRIKALAQKLYISQDAFEKRFRNIVGASPKQYASMVRMKSIIASGRSMQKSLPDLVFEAGFFDQAHFNKAFKVFTGQSPTDFFKTPPAW